MGQFGFGLYKTSDFLGFLQRSGYTDEYDFWSSLSSISEGTTFDHMREYLTSEGYSGSPHDQFRSFLEAQVGNIGTVSDMARTFFQGTFSTGVEGSFNIVDESGNEIVDESGNIISS